MTCFVCKKQGHMAKKCPNKKDKSHLDCFKCNKSGHIAKDCEEQTKEVKQAQKQPLVEEKPALKLIGANNLTGIGAFANFQKGKARYTMFKDQMSQNKVVSRIMETLSEICMVEGYCKVRIESSSLISNN